MNPTAVEGDARYATLRRLASLADAPDDLRADLESYELGDGETLPFAIIAGPVALPSGPEPGTLLTHGVVWTRQGQARLLLAAVTRPTLQLELVEAAMTQALALAFAPAEVEHALLDVPPPLAHLVMPLVRLGFVIAAEALPEPDRAAALVMRRSAFNKLHALRLEKPAC